MRASRGEASGPRDPLGRRSTAQFSELRPVAHSPEALRGLGDEAGGSKEPRYSLSSESKALSPATNLALILSGSGCGVRPGHQRCPAASPATLRVAKTRPFCKIRPRRALLKQFAASGECNEPCRVAVRRSGWRRTARLKEPQEHSPKHCPVSAPLRLRFRSAVFSRALRDSFYFGSPPK